MHSGRLSLFEFDEEDVFYLLGPRALEGDRRGPIRRCYRG